MLVLSCLLLHLLVRDTSAGPVYEIVEDDVAAVGSLIREVRQPRPLRVATEVEDLTSANNAPESRQDTKKRSKNASGTFVMLEEEFSHRRERSMQENNHS